MGWDAWSIFHEPCMGMSFGCCFVPLWPCLQVALLSDTPFLVNCSDCYIIYLKSIVCLVIDKRPLTLLRHWSTALDTIFRFFPDLTTKFIPRCATYSTSSSITPACVSTISVNISERPAWQLCQTNRAKQRYDAIHVHPHP